MIRIKGISRWLKLRSSPLCNAINSLTDMGTFSIIGTNNKLTKKGEIMEQMQIYIFGRGHVVLAPVVESEKVSGFEAFKLKSGYTIRKWGTDNGIGQLAIGPTSETVLDAIPYGLNIPVGALHTTVNVTEDGVKRWKKAFEKADADFLKGK